MLRLKIAGEELFDEKSETFVVTESFSVDLEHSLVSLSKWESKYQKPFLSASEKTPEEYFGYIQAMVIDDSFNTDLLYLCSHNQIQEIQSYIDSSQSATTFNEFGSNKPSREIITSELIYYWMVAFNIPFECETWHLNRLFSLIRICGIKNSKPKSMSRNEIAQRNRELNEQRKAQFNTRG